MRKLSRVTYDWLSISLFMVLLLVGILALMSSSSGLESISLLSDIVLKQILWTGIALVIFLAIQFVDWRFWSSTAAPIYLLGLLTLLLVLIFGQTIKGASSWFHFAGFSIQPSEFVKVSTAIGLSAYLGQPGINLKSLPQLSSALGLILLPMFLVLLQPDAGTVVVFSSLFLVLFAAGMDARFFITAAVILFVLILSLIAPFSTVAITLVLLFTFFVAWVVLKDYRLMSIVVLLTLFTIAFYGHIHSFYILGAIALMLLYVGYLGVSKARYSEMLLFTSVFVFCLALSVLTDWSFENLLLDHQKERINVWLKPALADPQGALYNIIQSKTTIGSGGLWGKGFLDGTMTNLHYVPEQNTDFIFCVIGEEWGFIGSSVFILAYFGLILRLCYLCLGKTVLFVKYFILSAACLLFYHFFINIGMTLGLMPVIGIPLPFISKGGSALIAFSILIAIVVKMDRETKR